MKLIVFSDTHGINYGMMEVMDLHRNADLFIHLGDGAPDFETLCQSRGLPYTAVRGNCDFCSNLPLETTLNLGGRTIFLTHGHCYGVKSAPGLLRRRGEEERADVILFGHTHAAMLEYYSDGAYPYYLMNPGALGSRYPSGQSTYGIIEIKGKNLLLSHGKL